MFVCMRAGPPAGLSRVLVSRDIEANGGERTEQMAGGGDGRRNPAEEGPAAGRCDGKGGQLSAWSGISVPRLRSERCRVRD